MVICLERCADLHMAQPMPLPLTVSCSNKIEIGFTFLVPAHLGSPGQRAVKRVCIITKVSNALNTLVSGGLQTLSKGLVVLLCSEVVRQRVPDHGAMHSECSGMYVSYLSGSRTDRWLMVMCRQSVRRRGCWRCVSAE